MTNQKTVKQIVAANLSDLRRARGLTQADLAAHLNYSDKAVSKWERGESLPDIEILTALAEFYGVNLDYMVMQHAPRDLIRKADLSRTKRNQKLIIAMSILLVWLVAALVFFILTSVGGIRLPYFLSFLYAMPCTVIVWLVLNSIWFRGYKNHILISWLMWSVLVSIFLSIWVLAGRALPLLFLLGIPGQIIIILWSHIRYDNQRAKLIAPNLFDEEA
ncbi:MAG: helix-turn-helix transcriptional regulator [Lachnospiraceae bacterium]|nr:helix-turn-helix transcriptional regulator [Lachnospiraceae bacterium]